jgi:hypothetical protein
MHARVPSILHLSSGRLLNHVFCPSPRRVGKVFMFFWVPPDGNTSTSYRESRSFSGLAKEGLRCEHSRWQCPY